MTLEERARKIAKECVASACDPYYVASTDFQQEKVIESCAKKITLQLREMLDELNIKF